MHLVGHGFTMSAEDPFKALSTDYLNLFTNGAAFSDVVFCVEGKQVLAHRCILAARSSFFRMLFCKGEAMVDATAASTPLVPQQIPVGVVGYDVFILLLQFLYSGQLVMVPEQGRSKCPERGCWHLHCTAAVDLALDALHAASFFGVEQLSMMIQKHLVGMVEKICIDDVMRVLVTAKKQGLLLLWSTCSELVARSGLTADALRKHLPVDIAAEIGEVRMQRGYGMQLLQSRERSPMQEQRILRMRQALDSFDVELVRLMVMGEGLDLDKSQALHYSVTNCSRDVVKALLEMGAVDVNSQGPDGKTALHLASEMACPDMISVLLDHHASPQVQSENGCSPLDVVQCLISQAECGGEGIPSPTTDHKKLRLCLELLQSAVYVADKEEDCSDGVVTEPSDNNSGRSGFAQARIAMDAPDCCSTDHQTSILGIRPELHPDWASMESSCSFEQEADHHGLLSDRFVRMASPQVSMHTPAALDGYIVSMYSDYRVGAHGAGADSKPSTTIF